MENNIGGKIKILAKVVLVIMILSAIGGALTAAITTGKATAWACPRTVTKTDYKYYGSYSYEVQEKNDAAGFFAGAGVFLAICGGGIVSAYVCYMFLYAYGQLVEDTQINRQTNQENQQILKNLYALKLQEANDPNAPETGVPEDLGKARYTGSMPKHGPTASQPVEAGKMRCPNCGAVQPIGRSVCWGCGAPFAKDAERKDAPKTAPLSEKWTCTKCNTLNDAGARYCMVCGEHRPKI